MIKVPSHLVAELKSGDCLVSGLLGAPFWFLADSEEFAE